MQATNEEKIEINQRVNLLLQNNNSIRKFLNNLPKDDLMFFQSLAEKKLDPKSKENQIRFKQILKHGTAGMSLREVIQLKKAFSILSKIR